MTPVIIFDQFEEIFTLEHNLRYRAKLFDDISEILLDLKESAQYVKFVISIREDFLGFLENMSVKIPSVFTNRFRLEALKRDAAHAAIIEPARKVLPGVEFSSPQFYFSDDARNELLDFLSLKMSEDMWISSEEIEPIQLQILLSELEMRVIKGEIKPDNGVITIQQQDLGGRQGMQAILGNFYDKQINDVKSSLSLNKAEIKALRDIIENDLIAGARRVPLAYNTIINKNNIRKQALDQLIKSKLLKLETHQGNALVEISHDTLVGPILKAYEIRKDEERREEIANELSQKRKKRNIRMAIYVLGIFLILGVVYAIRKYTLEERQRTQDKYYYGSFLYRRTNPTLSYKLLRDGYNVDTTNEKLKNALNDLEENTLAYIVNSINTPGSNSIYSPGEISDIRYDAHKGEVVINNKYVYGKDYMLKKIINPDSFYYSPGGKLYQLKYTGDSLKIINENQKELLSIPSMKSTVHCISDDEKYLFVNDAVFERHKPQAILIKSDDNFIPAASYKKTDKFYKSYYSYGDDNGASCFSADSKFLLDAGTGSQLVICNLQSGKGKPLNLGYGGMFDISHDSKLILEARRYYDTVYVFKIDDAAFWSNDTSVLKPYKTINFSTEYVNGLAFSTVDSIIAVGFTNGSAKVLNLNGDEKYFLKDENRSFRAIKFVDSNKIISGSNANSILIWKMDKPSRLYANNELMDYSPLELHYFELDSIDKKNTKLNFDDSVRLIINYDKALPQSNPYRYDKKYLASLDRTINETKMIYAGIFKNPSFKTLSNDLKRILIDDYALLYWNAPILLLQTDNESISKRYQRLLAYCEEEIKSLKVDTSNLGYAKKITNMLNEMGNFYFDSLCNFSKMLECHEQKKDLLEAYGAKFKTDSTIVDELADAYSNIAAMSLYAGQYEKGFHAAKKSLEVNSRSGHAYTCLVRYYLFTENYDEALKNYDKAKAGLPIGSNKETAKSALLRQITEMREQGVKAAFSKEVNRFEKYLRESNDKFFNE